MTEAWPNDAAALYCTFSVGRHWFGVDAQHVREVHDVADVTPIPGAPCAVSGYVNLRGQLYLVLDARQLLVAASPGELGRDRHLVVFRPSAGESFAIHVDALGDMVEVAGDRIDAKKQRSDAKDREQLTVGQARLEAGLLTLIDPRQLLSTAFGAA